MQSASKEPQHIETLPLYFDDLDVFGMVHHARIVLLLDRAFSAYFGRLGLRLGHEDASIVVRELTVTFEKSLRASPSVDVKFWVETIGATSVVFLFQLSTGTVIHAHGRRVMVKVDPVKGLSSPWSGEFRKKIAATGSSLRAEDGISGQM